jgi:hypothetical protein
MNTKAARASRLRQLSDRLFGHSGRPHGLRLHRGVRAVLEDDVGLPEGATDTGLRRGGRQLWIGPENEAAYLVSLDDADDVERWPAAKQPLWYA